MSTTAVLEQHSRAKAGFSMQRFPESANRAVWETRPSRTTPPRFVAARDNKPWADEPSGLLFLQWAAGNLPGALLLALALIGVRHGWRVQDYVLLGASAAWAALTGVLLALLGTYRLLAWLRLRRSAPQHDWEFDVGQAVTVTTALRPWPLFWSQVQVLAPTGTPLKWLGGAFSRDGFYVQAWRHGEIEAARIVIRVADPLGLFRLGVVAAHVSLRVNPRRISLQTPAPISSPEAWPETAPAGVVHQGDPFDLRACELASGQRILWNLWFRTGQFYTRAPEPDCAAIPGPYHLVSVAPEEEQPAAEVARWLVENRSGLISVFGLDDRPAADPGLARSLIRRGAEVRAEYGEQIVVPPDRIAIIGPVTLRRLQCQLAQSDGRVLLAVRGDEHARLGQSLGMNVTVLVVT